MKISEVARNSSVNENDIKSICKDLGIQISGDDGEISSNDAVYVKTRIESLKEERAKQAEQKLSVKKKIRILSLLLLMMMLRHAWRVSEIKKPSVI